MSKDPFSEYSRSLNGPANSVFKAVLSDVEEQAEICRGFMVTNQGDVAVTTLANQDIVIPSCIPGIIYPIRCKKFKATGTTAEVICLL